MAPIQAFHINIHCIHTNISCAKIPIPNNKQTLISTFHQLSKYGLGIIRNKSCLISPCVQLSTHWSTLQFPIMIIMTKFTKRDLIHKSNFVTLKRHNFIYTVHTSYNLNVTRVVYAETTRVAHACFCQKHAMTHATNYLCVQGYTRLYHLFTRKVEFYMHTRVWL